MKIGLSRVCFVCADPQCAFIRFLGGTEDGRLRVVVGGSRNHCHRTDHLDGRAQTSPASGAGTGPFGRTVRHSWIHDDSDFDRALGCVFAVPPVLRQTVRSGAAPAHLRLHCFRR